MVERLKRLALGGLGLVKRFLANKPANGYETIAFNAVRTTATYFGTGRMRVA